MDENSVWSYLAVVAIGLIFCCVTSLFICSKLITSLPGTAVIIDVLVLLNSFFTLISVAGGIKLIFKGLTSNLGLSSLILVQLIFPFVIAAFGVQTDLIFNYVGLVIVGGFILVQIYSFTTLFVASSIVPGIGLITSLLGLAILGFTIGMFSMILKSVSEKRKEQREQELRLLNPLMSNIGSLPSELAPFPPSTIANYGSSTIQSGLAPNGGTPPGFVRFPPPPNLGFPAQPPVYPPPSFGCLPPSGTDFADGPRDQISPLSPQSDQERSLLTTLPPSMLSSRNPSDGMFPLRDPPPYQPGAYYSSPPPPPKNPV